jgi:hypothetical protein
MTDRKTMQQAIDEWERQTTHSEYCWRWHHECAVKKFFNLSTPKVEEPTQPAPPPECNDAA